MSCSFPLLLVLQGRSAGLHLSCPSPAPSHEDQSSGNFQCLPRAQSWPSGFVVLNGVERNGLLHPPLRLCPLNEYMRAERVLPAQAVGRASRVVLLQPSLFAPASQPRSEAGTASATGDTLQGPDLGLGLRLWGETELGFGPGDSGSRPGALPPSPPRAPLESRAAAGT